MWSVCDGELDEQGDGIQVRWWVILLRNFV